MEDTNFYGYCPIKPLTKYETSSSNDEHFSYNLNADDGVEIITSTPLINKCIA